MVGTGYVGLVTGTCLAETGNNVLCIDIDKKKVDKMKKGEVAPVTKEGWEALFQQDFNKAFNSAKKLIDINNIDKLEIIDDLDIRFILTGERSKSRSTAPKEVIPVQPIKAPEPTPTPSQAVKQKLLVF